jgi:hypothetical protein
MKSNPNTETISKANCESVKWDFAFNLDIKSLLINWSGVKELLNLYGEL